MRKLTAAEIESPVIPEYSFEEGVKKAVQTIMNLLKKNPYITVAFSASGMHVGKSQFSSGIAQKLRGEGIKTCIAHDTYELDTFGHQLLDQATNYGQYNHQMDQNKLVFIFDQMNFGGTPVDLLEKTRKQKNQEVQTACQKLGYQVNGVDLWIGIYRPDKPFAAGKGVMADLLIRNEGARDKGGIEAEELDGQQPSAKKELLSETVEAKVAKVRQTVQEGVKKNEIVQTKLVSPSLTQEKLFELAQELYKKVLGDELNPDFPEFLNDNISQRYWYFSALRYLSPTRPILDAQIINKLQKGASLLTIGSGNAHLERFLQQAFGIKDITGSDIQLHPQLRESGLPFYQFDMLKDWPDLGRKFDFIMFPESLGIATMHHIGSTYTWRFPMLVEKCSEKILKGEIDSLPPNDLSLFVQLIEMDIAVCPIILNVFNQAIKYLAPGGQVLINYGIDNNQQKAYYMLKLSQEYPGIKFFPTSEEGLRFQMPSK